jgi:hypothetical protein
VNQYLDDLEEKINARTSSALRIHKMPSGVYQLQTSDGGILAETTHYGRMKADATLFATLFSCAPEIFDVITYAVGTVEGHSGQMASLSDALDTLASKLREGAV